MKWTICIATTPLREEQLKKLMSVLLPQIKPYPDVEILIFFNNFEYSLGFLRQSMIEEARGEYVSHIDDDDMVPDDYVSTIYPLLDGVDYIGFKVKFIDDGQLMNPVYHSLKHDHWWQDSDGYYRGVTHLNPVKRQLAVEAGFPTERNIGEDEAWANRVKAKTEHFIDKEMYIYNHVGDDSVAYIMADDETYARLTHENYKPEPHDTPVRPVFKSKQVRLHPRSTENAKNIQL